MLLGEENSIEWPKVLDSVDFQNSTIKLQDYLRKLKVTDFSGNDVIWDYSKNVTNISQVEPTVVVGDELDLENFAKASSIKLKYQEEL